MRESVETGAAGAAVEGDALAVLGAMERQTDDFRGLLVVVYRRFNKEVLRLDGEVTSLEEDVQHLLGAH